MKNLKHSDNTINFYVKENLKKNAMVLGKNNKLILNKNFFQQPHEVTFRSLSELIRLTGEKYLDDLGRILGFRVSKEGSDHWWTVHEEGTKSIPLDDFLEFESEWFQLVSEWIGKNACNMEKNFGKSQLPPL